MRRYLVGPPQDQIAVTRLWMVETPTTELLLHWSSKTLTQPPLTPPLLVHVLEPEAQPEPALDRVLPEELSRALVAPTPLQSASLAHQPP